MLSPVNRRCSDAFVALKVMHGAERLTWLTDLLAATHDVELAALLALAQGWCDVGLEDTQLSGRAYGEALHKARVEWLDQERG